MPRRRLDAEALRDAMLAVSGRLDRTVGGNEAANSCSAKAKTSTRSAISSGPTRSRPTIFLHDLDAGSIYLPVVRNALPDVLALFDAADPNGVTAVRNETTVPSQALFLLNHPFVREQALYFADRLLADTRATPTAAHLRVRFAPPSDAHRRPEASPGTCEFLDRYEHRAKTLGRKPEDARVTAWQSFCQSLLCCNEFFTWSNFSPRPVRDCEKYEPRMARITRIKTNKAKKAWPTTVVNSVFCLYPCYPCHPWFAFSAVSEGRVDGPDPELPWTSRVPIPLDRREALCASPVGSAALP